MKPVFLSSCFFFFFEQELIFDTCVQDCFVTDDQTCCFYLRPAKVNEIPASRAKMLKNYANCSHLTAAGCALDRRDQPLRCRIAPGCDTQPWFDLDPKTASRLWQSEEAPKKKQCLHLKNMQSKKKGPN